ncbi:hypothetical protein KSF_109310 [Reticulibacter mediterranei]|uniref:AB hydrolase-1 domain-containing protein n=1 Tax=Reticulibacter mediterranei TaxID=2778369 RepID=A0A8J3N9K3_9CHLR|nr:alpha/beta hydrolase [Reticulibacter mediterranei]GHP00884.1 hypothetical protein KSF_109310 [Reticulibacter mediterranei]
MSISIYSQAYERHGHGPALLFSHGGGMWHGCWGPILQEIAAACDCYTWDLPGHGASGPADSRPVRIEDYVASIEMVRERYRLQRRPIVHVIWSMSGLFYGAALMQEHLRARLLQQQAGLVLVGTSLNFGAEVFAPTHPRIAMLQHLFADQSEKQALACREATRILTRQPLIDEEFQDFFMHLAHMLMRRQITPALIPAASIAPEVFLQQHPTTVIHGAYDQQVPLQIARAQAERLGNELILFEHSAHMPFREEATHFKTALLAFVQKIEQETERVSA